MEIDSFVYGALAAMGTISFMLFITVLVAVYDLKKRMDEFEKKNKEK